MTALTKQLPFGRHDLRMALFVTRREVRDSFRDWRIILPIIVLTLIFPALANFTAARLLGFTERFGADLVGDRLIPFLLLVVGFFPMSFSLVIALETFVGEKERRSLEPLLATPLSNSQLYLGKMLAAIIPPMSTSYLGIAVYLLGLLLTIEWLVPFTLFFQILLLSTIQGIIMVAGAVIISSQTTSVRAANLLASFIIVPTALLVQFEAVVMFWGNNDGLWWLILALLLTAFTLIRMGVKIFNREELLGRDIDQLRLGWLWGLFWTRFSGRGAGGRYPGLRTWYRQTFALLSSLRQPSAALLVALVGALFLGVMLTRTFPLPAEMRAGLAATDVVANLSRLSLFLSRLPFLIFFQNLRVIAIATILGIFTFGVMDVVVFMLPWIFIGFLGGQMAAAGEDPLTFVVATILPHATVELPALLLAAAAALRWHATILAPPPNRTVSESWLLAAADFARLLVGLVTPLLVLASLIEAYVTPAILLQIYGG
ncbi:MAG: stage II sporulation protein M [Chloroflexi bacterium]|nr:stage II sporulation protein M [Chloroflexota bacterium]